MCTITYNTHVPYFRIDTHLKNKSTVIDTTNKGTTLPTTTVPVMDQPSATIEPLPQHGWQSESGQTAILEKGFKITRPFIYDFFVERRSSGVPTNNFRALRAGYNMFALRIKGSVNYSPNFPYNAIL